MTTNSIWLGLCAGIVPLIVMPVSAQVTPDAVDSNACECPGNS